MAEASAPAVPSNELLEWPKKDKRRLLHAVYRVGDLDRTIKFYTECFGMKLLRKRDIPEEKYSNAFLGFGPEESHFVVELTYNYGVDKYDIGTGFGHFAIATPDVYKLVEEIKAKGGTVTREPGPVKGGSSVIAFVKDPDGYLFEILQRESTPEPLCQVMLRVGDLERSIKFYEKMMDDKVVPEFTVDDKLAELTIPENVAQALLLVSNSSSLDKALEKLIELAKEAGGRLDLSSKNVVTTVLRLCQSLSSISYHHLLLLSLKVLRNLCAGEIRNQNEFLQQKGVEIVVDVIISVGFTPDLDCAIIRVGLQLLGNYSVGGGERQCDVWHQLFPHKFLKIAGVRIWEICDPLCMVIYTCCDGTDGLLTDLCSEQGFPILTEILRTASAVGLKEDWLKLILSKICIEGSYISLIFFKLHSYPSVENNGVVRHVADQFVIEQSYLLSILSEILNERIEHIVVSHDFALSIFGILKSVAVVVDFSIRGKSDLPVGSAPIDVLGYSLAILRDICACDHLTSSTEESSKDVVGVLVSSGLIEFLLDLLRELEPPTTIRKAMKQDQIKEGTISSSFRCCPYQGFRRDIIAILGNCAYRRRHVQDEIRDKNGILLLLQQCVIDEDNPFLREWGIWCVRNLLEGNAENQGTVADLELQGTVDVPELAGLGLRVEVDPVTRRTKLVNVP